MSETSTEERYRAFIENSAEGIWRFDLEDPVPTSLPEDAQLDCFYRMGFLAEANDAFARMYGFAQGAELTGARLGDFLVRDDPANDAYLRAFIRSGYRLANAESVETDKNGQRLYFSNTLTGIVENGALTRAWGTQRDITVQRETEARLRDSLSRLEASEHRYRILFETAAIGIVYQDSNAAILDANPAAQRILGLSLDQMQGRTSLDPRWRAIREDGSPFPGEDHYVPRALRSGQIERGVMGIFHPAEEAYRWLDVTAVPQFHQGEEPGKDAPYLVYATFEDITERFSLEQARREAEERFRLMANSAPVLIWSSDRDARCNWVNEPWLRFTGRTLEQELGEGWLEGVYPEDRKHCLQTYLQAFENRCSFTREYRLRRFDGEYRWVLDDGEPIFEAGGAFKGYIGSSVDISERKAVEEERERLVAELRESGARQRRFLREMLAGLTEGRLWLCFSESELPTPLPPQSDLVELTRLNLRLLRKRIELVGETLNMPGERQTDIITAAHEAGMNAVKYGGGGTARIHGDPAAGTIQVWIRDSGPGIAEEMLHRTIERGYTTAGFGHGFFYMRSCADRVYLFSETGKGTILVLEVDRSMPEPTWLRSSSREDRAVLSAGFS